MADDGGRKVKNESAGVKTSDEENVTYFTLLQLSQSLHKPHPY